MKRWQFWLTPSNQEQWARPTPIISDTKEKRTQRGTFARMARNLSQGVVLSKAGDPVPQSDIQPMTLKSATTSGAPGPLGEH